LSILTEESQKKLEALLVSEGLVQAVDLAKHKATATQKGKSLFTLIAEDKLVDDEALTRLMAIVSGVPYVNLADAQVDQKTLDLLPRDIAEHFMSVPLGEVQGRLAVAMLDANNVQAVDYLSTRISRPIKVYAASENGIRRVLEQYHTNLEEGVSAAIQTASEEARPGSKPGHPGEPDIKTIVQDSPISRALSTILEYAVRARASDIHIEPFEDSLRIRCRIDGVLREIMNLPKSIEPALISRVKILSNLKIDEHRVPQDGQFAIRMASKDVDLRIAISPVVWGEQVVIRLLDKSTTNFKLEDLGFAGRSLRMIRNGIKRPNGMVLTSGPTGSGKSTSLYGLIQEIKSEQINIVTLEDPVEYKMPGVNQIQVNPDVGLTFAGGLRSILRQDPNVIMVGEIRDKETADLAVQASLTGHLVFSTLHTNSAAGILPRLLDMGVEPFLIASTVNVIIGQRLLRKVAEDREVYNSSELETLSIQQTIGRLLPKDQASVAQVSADLGYKDLPLATQKAYTLVKGKNTPQTPGGYKGRIGLYEVMEVTEQIQNLIVKRATSSEIQRQAVAQGMVTMREDGYLKAITGQTTLEEVNRVAANMS
jgi:type IV pilus assembly protein PilB